MKLIASTFLLLVALAGAAQAESPSVANREVFFKSAEAARQALEYYGEHDDSDALERVNELGFRLAQESDYSDYPFSFFLVDMPIPNAFALPGGQIFITRGMLDLGLSDDMLAGLLGHEIGHVVLQHGTKLQKRATLLNVLSQALLVGVAVTASDNSRDPGPAPPTPYGTPSEGGDRVMGAAAAGIVVSELLLRSYGREFEDQADDEGLRLAAGAGFDPKGFEQLMALMNERLPQSKEYGYWSTHPFFDSRLRAASVRKDLLRVQEAQSADAFRRETQTRLLELSTAKRAKEKLPRFLENAAVNTWPRSEEAHAIRLARLEEQREKELEKNPMSRDYGRLGKVYRRELARLEADNPEDEHTQTLRDQLYEFDQALAETYPRASRIFQAGVYETDFLETYLSNYPEAPEVGQVSLALGEAYSRLQRTDKAVSMFLRAWKADPTGEAGQKAERGLTVLTPTLEELSALQEVMDQAGKSELEGLARKRLAERVESFRSLAQGAQFLKQHPESEFREAVSERLDTLAENLYGEALLYQRIGDHANALARIQSILTDAPLSPAANRLRAGAVFES